MPRIREVRHRWVTSSSGGLKAIKVAEEAASFSVYFTTSSGCTATVALQTCAESTLGPWHTLSPSTAMATGACLLQQFNGPLDYVRPFITSIKASTDVITVSLLAN